MNQWQIGRIKVTRIMEMEISGGTRFILPDASREACQPIEWMKPHFMDADGNLIMSIHALIIDTGHQRIIHERYRIRPTQCGAYCPADGHVTQHLQAPAGLE